MSDKKWLRALPGIVVSVAALAAVWALSDPGALMAALRQMPPGVVLAAAGLLAVSLVLRAAAWRVLLGQRVRWDEAFWALNAGYLVNNIIPFRAGEAARAALIAPRAKVSFWHAVSTVLTERLLDVVILAAMLVLTLPWVLDIPGARRASWVLGGGALAALVTLGIAARYRQPLAARLTAWKKKRRLSHLATIALRWGLAALDGLEALAHPLVFATVVALMAASWAVQVLAYGLTLQAVAPQASYLWAAFTLGSIGMGIAVPSAPGGLGVLEGVIVFVLGALGVDASVALAYALVMHGVYYAVTGLLGWLGTTFYGAHWRDLLPHT